MCVCFCFKTGGSFKVLGFDVSRVLTFFVV